MELYGLDPSVELSLDNLADYLNNIPSTQNGENVYLFDNNEFLRYMLLNGKIDIFTGSSSFQKQEFLTQAEGFYRLFQKFNQEITWGYSMNLFKNKSLIFMSGSNPIIQGFSANGVVSAYRAWQDKTDNILIPKGIKSNQLDDGYYSTPQLIVAVNTNCKDKEQAFRFVKYLMSDSVQNWDSTAGYCTIGWPVKTSALEQVKQVMLEDEQKTYGTNSGYREYLDACFKIVDQVIGCRSAYLMLSMQRKSSTLCLTTI